MHATHEKLKSDSLSTTESYVLFHLKFDYTIVEFLR